MKKKVLSDPKPPSGQDNRSSNNFSTKGFSGNTLHWRLKDGISFKVMQDKSGKDKTICKSLSNGSITNFDQSDNLYIANPSGVSADFMIYFSDNLDELINLEEHIVDNSTTILSDKGPKRGQDHRSSSNFNTSTLKGDTLEWLCDDGISFKVQEDIGGGGKDSVLIDTVKNGSITGMVRGSNLYIADPQGASEPFEIIAQGTGEQVDPRSWMGRLLDAGMKNTKISQLSIPGTHDSCTASATGLSTPWAICQTMSILTQLEAGIRFLDIRCRRIEDHTIGGSFAMYHGSVNLDLKFDQVLNQCNAFLDNHPGECIFMSIKDENFNKDDKENCIRAFVETFDKYSDIYGANWYLENKIPTLGSVRNKIVICRRFKVADDKTRGLNMSDWKDNTTFDFNLSSNESGRIQDRYVYDTINGKTNKWKAISDLLVQTKDGLTDKLVLNFTSATGLDGFVGSVLELGFINIPLHIAVDDINPELQKYFNMNPRVRSGIMIMDFPEQSLISKIIATNRRSDLCK